MSLAIEETEFDDSGSFKARFIEITTLQILSTVPAFLSKDKKYIQCYTPRNPMVNAFQYSSLESMDIQLSIDGINFVELHPKHRFSYYPIPRIKSISAQRGPSVGGTCLVIQLEHRIPDTHLCQARFYSEEENDVFETVDGDVSPSEPVIECKTPPWRQFRDSCGAIPTMVKVRTVDSPGEARS